MHIIGFNCVLLGENERKYLRREAFFSDNSAVMTEHDYVETLKAEFYMENQSEAFGFNRTLSIEGITCEYHNKDHNGIRNEGNVNMDFTLIFR